MRICLLSDPNYLHTQRWARAFLKRGHDVSIIGHYRAAPFNLDGVNTYILDERPLRGPWTLRTTRALRRLLAKIQPDVLHMHYLEPLVAPILLRFRPFVVSVWGSDILDEAGVAAEPWKLHLLKRTILRRADSVVALSEFLARATCAYASLPRERVRMDYWGVDIAQFPSRPKRKELRPFVLGFAKALLPKYGAEFLLRAVPGIRRVHPWIEVLLLGDGALRPGLEGLVRDLGIADVVRFCGRVEHHQVPGYVARMDLMVMPSVYASETFGLAAVEAQAMGVPVIASKIGGISEAVADGRTGILVPPGDPAAITQAVLRMINEPDLWEAMSLEGPRFVKAHFDWEQSTSRMEGLYRSVIAGVGRR